MLPQGSCSAKGEFLLPAVYALRRSGPRMSGIVLVQVSVFQTSSVYLLAATILSAIFSPFRRAFQLCT